MAREKKASVEVEGTSINFSFTSGETLSIDVAQLSDDIKTRGLVHGVRQKIQDAYAGVDAEKAHIAAAAVAQSIIDGNWTQRTESSGGGAMRTSMLAEALSRATGQDLDTCIETLATMEDDAKKAVRAHPQVKQELAKIKLERAQKELDESDDEEAPDLASMLASHAA